MLRYVWTLGLAGVVSAGLLTLPTGCNDGNTETKIEREVESGGGSMEREVEIKRDTDTGSVEREVEIKRDVDDDGSKVKVEKKTEVKHDHDDHTGHDHD